MNKNSTSLCRAGEPMLLVNFINARIKTLIMMFLTESERRAAILISYSSSACFSVFLESGLGEIASFSEDVSVDA